MKSLDPARITKAITNEMRRVNGLPPALSPAERAEAARLKAARRSKARKRGKRQREARRASR